MYNIHLEKTVQNFIKKHRGEKIILLFSQTLEILQQNPKTTSLDISSLKGYTNKYRLRIGKYRFLYELNENKIIIIFFDAGSRGEIYKKI